MEQPHRTAATKRKETDFESMERSLKGILKQIKRSTKGDLRDIADVAIISDYNVLVHHLRREGHLSPKMEASMHIAQSKLAGTSHEGNPITKGKCLDDSCGKKLSMCGGPVHSTHLTEAITAIG